MVKVYDSMNINSVRSKTASNPDNLCTNCGYGVYQTLLLFTTLPTCQRSLITYFDPKPHEIPAPIIMSACATTKVNEIVRAASRLSKKPSDLLSHLCTYDSG